MNDKAAVPILIEMLKDKNFIIQKNSVKALGDLKATESIENIIEMLDNSHIEVKVNAIKSLPDIYRLEIYGDGPEYLELLNLANNSRRIKFHGFVSEEKDIINAFIDADLMVLPSLVEEMPLSILEALAAKVPVLCTNHPTVKSIYGNYIFYLDNVEKELNEKIVQITTYANNEQKLNEGRKFASLYKWENNFKKIADCYKKLGLI